jgi:hypothetical protein
MWESLPRLQRLFDFDGSGPVNATDYNAFRARFGKVFTY